MKRTTNGKRSNVQRDLQASKLKLARETLRRLSERELAAAAGGDAQGGTHSCITCTSDDV